MNMPLQCPYCRQLFYPSPFRPQQRVCSRTECQRYRKADYHRHKRNTDPAYDQVCRESQAKWRATHPGYHRSWRKAHPRAVEANRVSQRRRDERRRLRHLVKNNLASDVSPFPAKVWLIGQNGQDLAKNNLAISHVVIYQGGTAPTPELPPS